MEFQYSLPFGQIISSHDLTLISVNLHTMMWLTPLRALLVAACAGNVIAASWSFEDATLTVLQGKGAGVGGGLKEKYVV